MIKFADSALSETRLLRNSVRLDGFARGAAGLDKKMVVIAQQYPRTNAPASHRAGLSQGLQKEPPVRLVVKDCFVSKFDA